MSGFFEGFSESTADLGDGRHFRLRSGGSGPPLVMLHGMPQTHCMWHRIAPALAARFTVICPDITGYGNSYKPAASADHEAYSKRRMAQDIVDLAAHLGIGRFALVGHDRGARVSHRLALDHPDRISRLALLDIIPTIEHFERTDMRFAMGYYHWFFLAQPAPLPEDLINRDAGYWLLSQTARHKTARAVFDEAAMADYRRAMADPATVTAICEDYRAAATIDLEHDRESRARRERIAAPLKVLWGSRGLVGALYDPLEIWRGYASGPVEGQAIESGHFLAEEAPEATLAALQEFLADG
ncbi:alpha/beta fold hydrolase [Acidiphilium cryptum]|uniref:Alpha/beta hydrolase fold protein n=2 Tax=Acidiphilium TaxID=522 RepID=A5FVX7_ACICJ|nr:alpha/beta hydrolase [Acidiphilium cryptum]ABQ29759.1 alpha/beta hydrolase fold protein [Acidiphilium cryptum JF-5]